jgi:hypothetical protein
MLSPVLCLLAGFALQAQPPAQTSGATPRRLASFSKPVLEMIDQARSTPPEFAADALLRIAEGDTAATPADKRELIEEAFRLAAGAQEPLLRRGIKPGTADTLVSFQSRAYGQELDALSLQSRAVIDMLRADKPKARELFSQMAPPQPPKAQCADQMVYDVGSYYQAMSEVAANSFTAKERLQEENVKFLAGFAGRISSEVEVGPMARTLASAAVSPDQMQLLLTTFSAALKSISGDDRSFSATVDHQGSSLNDLGALAAAAKGQKISSLAYADAIRGYLARHLGGKRCWDTGGFRVVTGLGGVAPQVQQPDAVAFFNNSLLPNLYPADSVLPKLEGDEIRASSVEDPIDQPTAWQGQDTQDLVDHYNGLLFNPNSVAWTADEKNSSVWQNKLREYLGGLAAWKPGEGSSASEYFYRKCYLFSSLINVVPNGPTRELVLHNFLDFLQQNTYQQTKRMEWFLPVNTLLIRVMIDPSLKALADELRNSGDAVISMYARLDTMFPRSPAKVMGLL